jgi:ABC-type transport system substrate-binding protein
VLPTPESQLIGQVIQAQLKDVGINVTVDSKETAAIISDTVLGNYESTGFILFGSPSLDREYVFFAGPAKPIGSLSLNFTRIPDDQNQAIVDAMAKVRTTDDPEVQKEQYAIVQQEMAKNLNMLFLVQSTTAVIFRGDVHGVLTWPLPEDAAGQGGDGLPSTVPFTGTIWKSAG